MKASWSLMVFVVVAPLSLICSAAEFRNLDFEEADTDGVPLGSDAPIDRLLPGWRLTSIDGSGCLTMHQNVRFGPLDELAKSGAVSLRRDRIAEDFPQGNFYVSFARGRPADPVWKLEQRGTIPLDAKFLTYRYINSEMQLEIDRMAIQPLNRQGLFPPFGFSDVLTNLVYDVSRFAGQEVTLSFVGPFGELDFMGGFFLSGRAYIDRVHFAGWVPKLSADRPGSHFVIRWRAADDDYMLQSTVSIAAGAVWQPVPVEPVRSGEDYTVKVNLDDNERFYRLTIKGAE